ncbi:MAG: hypothetical protein ACP5T9_04055, partial [Thermoplasmata archaeon]
MGSIAGIVSSVIGALLSLLNALLFGILTLIWQYIYGFLEPQNAFPSIPYTSVPKPYQFAIVSPQSPWFSYTLNGFVYVASNWALYFINYLVIP